MLISVWSGSRFNDQYYFPSNFSYGKTNNASGSSRGTFNIDPYSLVANPNDFLNFDQMTDDPLERYSCQCYERRFFK